MFLPTTTIIQFPRTVDPRGRQVGHVHQKRGLSAPSCLQPCLPVVAMGTHLHQQSRRASARVISSREVEVRWPCLTARNVSLPSLQWNRLKTAINQPDM